MSVTKNDLKEGRINDQIGSQLESITAQMEASVERGKNALEEWSATLADKSAELRKTINRYSHEHPWRMVSSALAAGLVLGLLFRCKSGRSAQS